MRLYGSLKLGAGPLRSEVKGGRGLSWRDDVWVRSEGGYAEGLCCRCRVGVGEGEVGSGGKSSADGYETCNSQRWSERYHKHREQRKHPRSYLVGTVAFSAVDEEVSNIVRERSQVSFQSSLSEAGVNASLLAAVWGPRTVKDCYTTRLANQSGHPHCRYRSSLVSAGFGEQAPISPCLRGKRWSYMDRSIVEMAALISWWKLFTDSDIRALLRNYNRGGMRKLRARQSLG